MNPNVTQMHFSSSQELCRQMKERVIAIVHEGIKKRGEAYIALSGGNTPKSFFKVLSESDLPWDKVVFTLVDERWVDKASEDSNEYLVRNYLLRSKASEAAFIGLKSEVIDPEDGIDICTSRLAKITGDFDLVILGMGEDGHTASFFPQADRLGEALTSEMPCILLLPPEAPYSRITLTLSRLVRAKHIFLHIEGENKLEVFQQALQEGAVEAMPIRAFIRRQEKPFLEVFYAE